MTRPCALLVAWPPPRRLQAAAADMFAGGRSQHRESGRASHVACATGPTRRFSWTAQDVMPQGICPGPMATFSRRASAPGEWRGPHGTADSLRRQHWIGGSDLGPCHGLRRLSLSAGPRPRRALRIEPSTARIWWSQTPRPPIRLRRFCRWPPRPSTTQETIDQRPQRARLAATDTGQRVGVAKHVVAVSTNAQEVAKFGDRSRQHV